MLSRFDVIVVGAGTGGAYLSYLLAKQGLNVCLIEMKSIDKVYKYTGDAIGKHHIDKLGIEVPSKVIVWEYDGVEIFDPTKTIKYVIPGKGYALDIYEWQQWLIKLAINAGTQVFDRHRALTPIVENGFVTGVKAMRSDGSIVEFKSKIVVDATGPVACIRTRLSSDWLISEPLQPEDASYAYREILELDEEVENPKYIKIYLDVDIAPGGYWWLFPKGRNIVNIGLGIWGKLVKERNYQPIKFYEKYIKSKLKVKKVLSSGGGIVPTRRPIKSLVGSGIVTIGDAGFTVNPVHGGGLGPTLLSARLAANVILEAFEKGDFSVDSLWKLNIDYVREYGIKQVKLDIFRLMLQTLSNRELHEGLKKRILNENDILEVSSSGKAEIPLTRKVIITLKLLSVPRLAQKLLLAVKYMREIEKIYEKYPENIRDFDKWYIKFMVKYNEFRVRLGLNPIQA